MSISIIVEWENAVLSELQRARDMLRRMQAQVLARSGDQFEILVMYNPEQVQRGLIEGVLATDAVAELKNAFRLVAAPGMHYYDLKNEGPAGSIFPAESLPWSSGPWAGPERGFW